MEADTGVMDLQAQEAKDCWQPLEAREEARKDRILSWRLQREWICQHLYFRLLASQNVTE